MKIHICILAIIASTYAGILNNLPNNLYSGTNALSNQLGSDCYTTYGHGGEHQDHQNHGVFKLIAATDLDDGLTHYDGGVQYIKILPVAHLTSGIPLSAYTPAGHYGTTFQLLQPLRYVQQSPVLKTVKIIQQPSSVFQTPQVKTIKIIKGTNSQGPAFKRIRLVEEPVQINSAGKVKTIRILNENTNAQPAHETETLRIIDEQSKHEIGDHHENPFVQLRKEKQNHEQSYQQHQVQHHQLQHHQLKHHQQQHYQQYKHQQQHNQQHHSSIPIPTPHILTELTPPPEDPPHSDVNQNDFRFTSQPEQGYGYNAPFSMHLKVQV